MNGPGNFAIDREGFLWVSDNYEPAPPFELACAGERLLKFYPWGESFPGSPYFGGGLSGAGFGITIAPNGLIWVGNFGFAGTGCPLPPANSVSVVRPDGEPLSRQAGLTAGPISWPQATVADRKGTSGSPTARPIRSRCTPAAVRQGRSRSRSRRSAARRRR